MLPMMFHRMDLPMGAIVLALMIATGAPAQDESTDLRAAIEAAIEGLGASSFADRELATNTLYRAGAAALPALRKVDRHDLERWMRAQRVIERIEKEQFEKLAKSFLLAPHPDRSYQLPAWPAFCRLAGDSRSSKLLFIEMLKTEPELMEAIDEASRLMESNEDARTAIARLEQRLSERAKAIWEERMRMRIPGIGQLASLLLGTSLLPEPAPAEVNALMEASINMVPFTSYLNRRGYAEVLKSLLAEWIPRTQPAQAEIALSIALRYDLPSGIEVARRCLSPTLDVRLRQLAMMNVVRFGSPADIPLLVDNMQDSLICEVYQFREGLTAGDDEGVPEVPPGLPIQPAPGTTGDQELKFKVLRICDLALAVAMVLNDEDPRDLFVDYRPHEMQGIDPRSIAVEQDAKAFTRRDEAIKQWLRRYRAERNES